MRTGATRGGRQADNAPATRLPGAPLGRPTPTQPQKGASHDLYWPSLHPLSADAVPGHSPHAHTRHCPTGCRRRGCPRSRAPANARHQLEGRRHPLHDVQGLRDTVLASFSTKGPLRGQTTAVHAGAARRQPGHAAGKSPACRRRQRPDDQQPGPELPGHL